MIQHRPGQFTSLVQILDRKFNAAKNILFFSCRLSMISNYLCYYKLGSVDQNISDSIKYFGAYVTSDMKLYGY